MSAVGSKKGSDDDVLETTRLAAVCAENSGSAITVMKVAENGL
jgi:hypothetical protein